MKNITLIFSISILVTFACSSPKSDVDNPNSNIAEMAYDSVKASKYGADDYGMKPYVMAFLKIGPNRPTDSAAAASLQRAHLDNINGLAEEGILVLAGPFMGKDSLRGIYIFDTPSLAEAQSLVETDPAIQSGSLVMDLRLWYGSAALMEINSIHQEIAKINI